MSCCADNSNRHRVPDTAQAEILPGDQICGAGHLRLRRLIIPFGPGSGRQWVLGLAQAQQQREHEDITDQAG